MTDHNDAIVADYLDQVSRAMTGVPAGRRDELIRDLREHIEVGRAEFTGESEAQVRAILERLGDPETIASAAAAAEPGVPQPESDIRQRKPMSRRMVGIVAVVAALALIALCVSVMFFAQASDQLQ